MGLTSHTGLLASVLQKCSEVKPKNTVELKCQITRAPFILRPYASLYNPFSHNCSILCNHPADTDAKEFVKKAKEVWSSDNKHNLTTEELITLQEQNAANKENKSKLHHDIVTEDMFRRYAETDSRPLTPAPTLASGKSKSSRRCLTPDQPRQRTAIVLDLRRSHSQETLYYHGYTTSDLTVGHATTVTNERSTLPSLNISEATHARLIKGQCEQLPPLASPLILSKRAAPPARETNSGRNARKNQLKSLNLGKGQKGSNKIGDAPVSQRSKADKESNDGNENFNGGETRRRGKRRRKGRQGSDRMTSAGLAAQAQQDPETQIAGIGTESHNPSSRGSVAKSHDDDMIVLPVIKTSGIVKKTDSFLDDDILKYLHREVDEEAIETEFDPKRRYVLEEALRTRPDRPHGVEMQTLLREYHVPAVSLGDWLHIPRVFSRQNAQFSLPINTNDLETLTPMKYAARYVTLKKSKQLLYLTVLRKFNPQSYRMPIASIEEGLILMMGGILTPDHANCFKSIMEWDSHVEEVNLSDDIKLTMLDKERAQNYSDKEDQTENNDVNALRYRTWCGLCAICERMYGRYPPRELDPPDGMELSDFSMIETKLATLNMHTGLVEVLNIIRQR